MPYVRATFLVLAFVLNGCGEQSAETPKGALECPDRRIVCVRVENASGLDFQRFDVNFEGQVVSYGPLGAGAISEYRPVDAAYGYAYSEAFSNERRFVLQPIDFLGEKLLEPGAYTYRYTASILDEPIVRGDWALHGQMDVRLIADDERGE